MKKVSMIAAFVLIGGLLSAQPDRGKPNNTPTPFGFVELLIAAGAAFGGKKVYDAKKKADNQ